MSDGSSPGGSDTSWLRSIFNGSDTAADDKAKSSQSYVIKPDALEERIRRASQARRARAAHLRSG